MIKIQVIGHLGNDATVNEVSGKKVINFNIAHTEKYTDRNGSAMQKTQWVQCAYWTDKVSVAQYLLKGTQVYVEGSPEVKTFERRDGTQGAELSCRVFSVQLLGGRKEGERTGTSGNQAQSWGNTPTNASDITEPIDDLPF